MTNQLKNKINKVISSNFSKLNGKKLKFYEGFDFVTVLVDGLAIRFPKNKKLIRKLEIEKIALKALFKKVDFLIPEYKKNPDKSFGYYNEIVGSKLTVSFYNNLSESKKTKLCKDLAMFISQMHSLKLSKNISQEIPKINNDITFQFSQRKKVLTHGDLSGDNIIINKNGELVGIIDFGDISFSDPIVDFSHFWPFGEKMIKKVVFFYTKNKKEGYRILEDSKRHYACIKILIETIKNKNKKGV